ncbi:hypothetical protein DFJ73DRAFT_788580 [Zopfochytrium polystomum]|nr:hypothetical protein DFJ73DRAFT_788580 [Zopfochytrium polystomum]
MSQAFSIVLLRFLVVGIIINSSPCLRRSPPAVSPLPLPPPPTPSAAFNVSLKAVNLSHTIVMLVAVQFRSAFVRSMKAETSSIVGGGRRGGGSGNIA